MSVKPFESIKSADTLTASGYVYQALAHLDSALKKLEIPDCEGDQIKNIAAWNVVKSSLNAGNIVIKVNKLENLIEIQGDTLLYLKNDAGVLKWSASDDGPWEEFGSGSGDMLKATYDTDDDGIIDYALFAESLQGTGFTIPASILPQHLTIKALSKGGGSEIANAQFGSSIFGKLVGKNQFSMFFVLELTNSGAEDFFHVSKMPEWQKFLVFGKDADDYLFVEVGDGLSAPTRYTSDLKCFDANYDPAPLHVGFSYDVSQSQLVCACGGKTSSAIPYSTVLQGHDSNRIVIGQWIGRLFYGGAMAQAIFQPNSTYAIPPKGLAYGDKWLCYYDLAAGSGNTLYDRISQAEGGSGQLNLSVWGEWV